MAKINNPRKQFQFTILISGMNPFLAQEVKTPDEDFDTAMHGDTNFEVKTAGIRKIGDLTVNKISPVDAPDTTFRDWFNQIQDTELGGGDLPSNYKRIIEVIQYSNDGVTPVESWKYGGCWPKKKNGLDFNRKGSENTIQALEFSIDELLEHD